MSVVSLMFNVLVTPAGTTFLEAVSWCAFFILLVLWRRRGRGEGDDSGVGVPPTLDDSSFVHSYILGTTSNLRRRPIATNESSDQSIQPTASDTSVPSGNGAGSRQAYRPLVAFGTIFSYMKLITIAYFIDAVFFLLISLFMHNSILFIPTPCTDSTAAAVCNYSFPFDQEFYWTNPRTNDTLHVVFIRGSGANVRSKQRPLLFTHGNSHNIAYPSFLKQYQVLTDLGFDVYTWDYPGYGKSRIDPSFTMSLQRFHDDAGFILKKVSNLSSTDSRDVILWGFSMGGAISTALAVQQPIRKLILHNPPDRFDWIVREGTKLTGWLSTLPQYKVLDVFSLISNVRSPTRVLHLAAELDHYVTHARQERLFEQLPVHVRAQSKFVTVRGLGHNSNPFDDGNVPSILQSFLVEHDEQ